MKTKNCKVCGKKTSRKKHKSIYTLLSELLCRTCIKWHEMCFAELSIVQDFRSRLDFEIAYDEAVEYLLNTE